MAVVDVEGLCHDLRDLPRKRGGLLHFAEEEPDRRQTLSAAIGRLGLTLTAVVRHGSDCTDRARAVALTTLAGARHSRLTKNEHPALWVPDFVAGPVFQSLARNAPETLLALGDVDRRDC